MKIRLAFAVAALIALSGCDRLPGRPGAGDEVVRPDQVLDFNTLYKENCSGCHGDDGKGGASIALRDPVFLAIADDTAIRNVATAGVLGSQMPPFAQSKGGMLTDKQIDVLVQGIRAWARADVPRDGLPPYSAPLGDPQRGAAVYSTFCASCHEGGASPVTNSTYLSLVSDQYLRTVVIAGRPELGAPDWRGNVKGRPMTAEEISDVVAWLASQRSTAK
jgi:cytochrome c oxidase cbb3-type subunit III